MGVDEEVSKVIEATPLIIKSRKTPIDLDRQDSVNDKLPPPIAPVILKQPDKKQEDTGSSEDTCGHYMQNLQLQPVAPLLEEDTKSKLKLHFTPPTEDTDNASTDHPNSNSESCKDLTPDDALNSISRVNYDIDFSDMSGENSVADDLSPENMKEAGKENPLIPPSVPLVLNDETIMDENELPPEELPSPIKPTCSKYLGFSTQGCQIPSIPCNTGDLSLLASPNARSRGSHDENDDEDKVLRVVSGVLDKLF